jgi:hypothetical protein
MEALMPLKLTADEIRRYVPYNRLKEFEEGYNDYRANQWPKQYQGLKAQAYDRGYEMARMRKRELESVD